MRNPLKILVISNYNNTISARPEAEIYLALAQKKDFEIEVMTDASSDYAIKFKDHGIRVIDHVPTKKLARASISLIKDTLTKGRHDILMLYNSKAIVNGLIAAKHLSVKVILYRGYAGNISWIDPTMYLKYFHPRVDKIICNAHAAQHLFERQLGFKKGKAVTIHKGHDLKWYKDVPEADLSTFGIPKNAFTIVTVANARPFKGIKYLLNAFSYLPKDLPIYFLLIGSGQDNKENLSIIAKSSYKNKIKLLGFRKDSLSIVKASDIFVLSSLGQETITKSVIEAMSLGTTPLITEIEGNKELVINNESGLTVPIKNSQAIAEKIMSLFENPEKRTEMGKNATQRIASALSHQKTVEDYGDFFRLISK